jgi:hypothetical protein
MTPEEARATGTMGMTDEPSAQPQSNDSSNPSTWYTTAAARKNAQDHERLRQAVEFRKRHSAAGAEQEAARWAQAHPEFYKSKNNAERMASWIRVRKLPWVAASYQAAFEQLMSQGKLERHVTVEEETETAAEKGRREREAEAEDRFIAAHHDEFSSVTDPPFIQLRVWCRNHGLAITYDNLESTLTAYRDQLRTIYPRVRIYDADSEPMTPQRFIRMSTQEQKDWLRRHPGQELEPAQTNYL